jgi:hypothetical protein
MKIYGLVEVYLHYSRSRYQIELSGLLHAPAALLPGNRPRYPLDKRLGMP